MLNVGGWLFTIGSFVLFYAFWRVENTSSKVLIAGFIAILSHHILSALNVVYGPFPFAQLDAHSFHLHGIQRVDIPEMKVWSVGSDIYKSMLGTLYGLFGKSRWMGQTFSILFFALCCLLVIKIAREYKLSSIACALCLLIYGFLPSSLLYGSFTLRETFFTAFFILGVFFSYKAIYLQTIENRFKQWQYFALAVIAFFFMGIFHMILLIYALAISAALFLVIYAQNASKQKVFIQLLLSIAVVAVLIYVMKHNLSVHISDDYFAMLRIQVDGEVVPIPHAISIYHQTANESGAATQYNASLEFTTWTKMVFVFLYSYVFYLGWPVTGDYTVLTTWVLLSEAIVRLVGIVALCVLSKRDKKWLWLLFVYVSITFLWNIGTSNHGQALRHHFMTEWIPILAMMFFVQRFKWFEIRKGNNTL